MRALERLVILVGVIVSLSGISARASDDQFKAALKLHKKECLRCHGKEGKGDGPSSRMLKVKPADWTDAKRMSRLSDADLTAVIKGGGEALGRSKLMPAFRSKLSDEEISELVAFIKSLRSPEEEKK